MTYRERLIAKRMIDLKELANEYSVKINEKGSKAIAVDKILQKIDEVLHQEFPEEAAANIKAELDQGVTLTMAIDNARAAIATGEFEDDANEPETPVTVPAELAPTEPPVADPKEDPEEPAEQTEVTEPIKPAKPTRPTKKTPATRKSKKVKELTYKGRTQSIKDWAEELQLPYPTLYDRINRNGWSVEEAIEIPLGGRR